MQWCLARDEFYGNIVYIADNIVIDIMGYIKSVVSSRRDNDKSSLKM